MFGKADEVEGGLTRPASNKNEDRGGCDRRELDSKGKTRTD
jgi:hypothetical protein